jgi:hypothetical protein
LLYVRNGERKRRKSEFGVEKGARQPGVQSECVVYHMFSEARAERSVFRARATPPWNQREWLEVYYEAIQRELNRRLIYECRCDERLKAKAEGSTRLAYTGLRGGLEHLKIETMNRGVRFIVQFFLII